MLTRILTQLLSLVLPLTVLVVVPRWIEPHPGRSSGLLLAAGISLIVIGLPTMVHTILAFIRIGRGTLAPWSPTKELVTGGMYAYVRNPMILGVLMVLLGEALTFGSWRILAWAGAFWAINTIYFELWEEPGLELRFGEAYRQYKQNVPRWIPRHNPYHAARGRGPSS